MKFNDPAFICYMFEQEGYFKSRQEKISDAIDHMRLTDCSIEEALADADLLDATDEEKSYIMAWAK